MAKKYLFLVSRRRLVNTQVPNSWFTSKEDGGV